MKVVGLDPAFANFGMVAGGLFLHEETWAFKPSTMLLVTTKGGGKHREVRKSSENLARGQELHKALHIFLDAHQPDMVFVEVPSGAQNANAAMGLGLAVGILASIRVPLIEVAPIEIKRLFTTRQQSVPKRQIMDWAYDCWPTAPWLRYTRAGKVIGKNKKVGAVWNVGDYMMDNEHLADACATVVAGVKTPTFLQLMALRGAHEVSMPDHHRHSSGGQPSRRVPVGAVSVDQPEGKRVRRQIDPSAW